jgi:hypothetical protein
MEDHNHDLLSDSVESPPGLASRTCARIWSGIDNDEPDYEPNSGTFLNSAYFSPETVMPAEFLLQTTDAEEVEPQTPKVTRKVEIADTSLPRSTGWIGLVASVSVGIVIAIFMFPMLRYLDRSTRSYVADSWMGEISRRVEQYEQIHGVQGGGSQVSVLPPYNLALSGWQEVHHEVFAPPHPAFVHPEAMSEKSFVETFIQLRSEQQGIFSKEVMQVQQQFILSDFFEKLDEPIPLNVSGLSDHILLVMPGREPLVRSAYGQGLLLKDGRVFSRIPPSVEVQKK